MRQKWKKLLKQEPRFPNCYDERPKGETGGILPRSNRQKHIRRWKNIAQWIDKKNTK